MLHDWHYSTATLGSCIAWAVAHRGLTMAPLGRPPAGLQPLAVVKCFKPLRYLLEKATCVKWQRDQPRLWTCLQE